MSSFVYLLDFQPLPDKDNEEGERDQAEQAVSKDRMNYFQPKETAIVKALTKIKDSAGDISAAIHLFQEVDEDGSGEIDREEFAEMVRQMGIGMSENRIDEVVIHTTLMEEVQLTQCPGVSQDPEGRSLGPY